MDFAAEPVLDAFTPPPSRAAGRNAPAPADENGQTFEDHLEAANEAAPERPPQRETRNEAPVEDAPVRVEGDTADDAVDPDTALLGGPLPAATPPPPMAAPVAVQIATAEPALPQTQQASDDAAPITAPQAPVAPPTKTAPAEQSAASDDVAAPAVPASGKNAPADVKQTAPDAPQTQTTPNAQSAPANTATAQNTAPQPEPPSPITVHQLPPEVRQALAATIAPAPPLTEPTTPRVAATQPAEGKTAPDAAKSSAVGAANAKTQTAKSSNAANAAIDAAAAPPQTQNAAPDASQMAENLAVTTTTSQASTHVQHAAAETGTQRAAPAATQVGQEIIRRFNGGTTSFELRLDPPELGRVEVRMEVSRDHKVTAVISADNPQALTELARHARDLEQQLQQAGLQLGDNGLSFDLRQGREGGDAEQTAQARGAGGEDAPAEQQQTQTARPLGLERWRGVRVDISV